MKPLSERLLEPAVPTAPGAAPGAGGAPPGAGGAPPGAGEFAAELCGLRSIQPETVIVSAFVDAPGGTAGGLGTGGRCVGSCVVGGTRGAEVGGACGAWAPMTTP